MTARDFAAELDALAGRIGDVSRADLQTALRRAALRLRNTMQVPLDPEWEDALASVAGEMKLSRNELIRAIVKDWLIAHSYLPAHMIEEDSDVDGRA